MAQNVTPVTVVSVFYDRAPEVRVSINSLLDQTHPSMETVLWDDGSSDATLTALRCFEGSRVRVLTSTNQGFTRSIRKAVEVAQTPYIAIHGAGDISLPQRLLKQAQYLDAHPHVGMVGCGVRRASSERPVFRALAPQALASHGTVRRSGAAFTHGEVMFRRDLYDMVGGYREAFVYAQDMDLWLRMLEHSQSGTLDDVLYIQRPVAGTVGLDPARLLRQAEFFELAKQCAKMRLDGGPDLVELYGEGAVERRQKSRRLAHSLLSRGMRWRIVWSDAAGLLALAAAKNEGLSPGRRLALPLLAAPADSAIWRSIIKPLIQTRISHEDVQGR